MKVVVTESTLISNPIGDGHDYGPGEVFEMTDALGESWIARGWVRPYTAPSVLSLAREQDEHSDAP